MKRFLFYCKNCDFIYSGESEEPCPCSFCGTMNECCGTEEVHFADEEIEKNA